MMGVLLIAGATFAGSYISSLQNPFVKYSILIGIGIVIFLIIPIGFRIIVGAIFMRDRSGKDKYIDLH